MFFFNLEPYPHCIKIWIRILKKTYPGYETLGYQYLTLTKNIFLLAQGIHIQCGQLDFDRPRWKCDFCREVVRNLPNKPVSVFRRVRTGRANPVRPLLGSLLDRVTFRLMTTRGPLQERNMLQVSAIWLFIDYRYLPTSFLLKYFIFVGTVPVPLLSILSPPSPILKSKPEIKIFYQCCWFGFWKSILFCWTDNQIDSYARRNNIFTHLWDYNWWTWIRIRIDLHMLVRKGYLFIHLNRGPNMV